MEWILMDLQTKRATGLCKVGRSIEIHAPIGG